MRFAHIFRPAKSGRRAFTAVELLIALGLIAVTAGVSIPMYREYQVDNDLTTTTEALVQFLRGAQTLSQNGKSDSVWGVYVPEATLFAGEAYDVRNQDNDLVFQVPSTIDTEGIVEVTFTRLDGRPSETGMIRVISTLSGKYRDITIDPGGVITVSSTQLLPSGYEMGDDGDTGDTGGNTGGSSSAGGGTGSSAGTTSSAGGSVSSAGNSSSAGGTTSSTASTGGGTSSSAGTGGGDDGDGDIGPGCNTRYDIETDNTVKVLGTNDIKVRVLGSQITYGAGGPGVAVRVSSSFDDGSAWTDMFNGKAVEGNEQQTFANIPANTPFALQFNGRYSWLFNKTYRSDSRDGHVIILKNGDTPPNYPAFSRQDSLETFLRGILDNRGKISIGAKDLVFLVELGSLDQNADFQDAVVLVTFTEKPSTCPAPGKPRLKIDFQRVENSGDGNAANDSFVGPQKIAFSDHQWIPLTDANGNMIIDGGLVEDVEGLAIERGPGWVRIVSHGSLTSGSKEIVDARALFAHSHITSIVNDTGSNATENPRDGVMNDTAGGDEFVDGPNAKSMTFKTRVTGENDGVYLYWTPGQPSAASSSSGTSSSSSSSRSSSSSSSSIASNSSDPCYVPYTVNADGRVTLQGMADISLRIAGTESTYGQRGPKVSVRGRISFDGGSTWKQLSSYRALRGGELSVFRSVPSGSAIMVEFEGRYSWVFRKTVQSGRGNGSVRVLQDGSDIPNIDETIDEGGLKAFLRVLNDNGILSVGSRELVYMVELTEPESTGDFQDLVAVLSIDKPQSAGGCGTATGSSSSTGGGASSTGSGTASQASSSSSAGSNPNADDDKDGVKNVDDLCTGTAIPESVPTEYMSFERYALTAARGNLNSIPVFREGPRKKVSKYTIEDTRGCSCAQLLDAIDNKGFHKFNDYPVVYRQMKNLFAFYTENSRKFGCGDALMKMVKDSR